MALIFQLEAVIPEKVIICVACRDVSEQLPYMIPELENLGSLFQDYRIVTYENNSDDDTPSQLFRWKRLNPKVSVTVEYINDFQFIKGIVNRNGGIFSALEQKAQARNKVLQIALSQFNEEFSHIICVEPNMKIVEVDEFKNIFQSSDKWDAIFAYGTDQNGKFNDWDAFRDSTYPCGPELMGDVWYTQTKEFSLSKSDLLHPVYSAFGGCAIYKRKAIQNCKYEGLVSHDLESATLIWLTECFEKDNPQVIEYLESLNKVSKLVYINSPRSDLPKLTLVNCGVYINQNPTPIIWKMHGSSERYPAVCEHVAFNSSVYCHGYKRLFINPRLVCVQRDNRYAFRPN